jgi:hypothetical protein
MKQGELRIGNYIEYCDEFYVVDYECIRSHMGDEQDDAYQGIPLDHKWLKKIKNESFKYFLIENKHRDCYQFETSYGYINIKYVHQLQNLFFALTGEELEIK